MRSCHAVARLLRPSAAGTGSEGRARRALLLAGFVGLTALPLAAAEGTREADPMKSIREAAAQLREGMAADREQLVEIEEIKVKKKEPPKEAAKEAPPPAQTPVNDALQRQAREEARWATQQLSVAEAAVERALQAPNPATAQVELRDAFAKAEMARTMKRRAEAAMQQASTISSTSSAAPEKAEMSPTRPSGFRFESETFRALQNIQEKKRDYENAKVNRTPMTDARDFDPKSGVLVAGDGKKVDVKPLVDAVHALPQLAESKVFVPENTPAGRVYRVDPQVQKALATPQGQEHLQKIGGVALDATLNLLSYAGVPEFRRLGPATVVEKPVLVSLRELYAKLQPFAADATTWASLPPELRHPANIERIHGYVLDAEHEDVFLVAAAADRASDAIDIDSLIMGIQAVWQGGMIPAISLDPVPSNFLGPQYSRVYGLPADCMAAKIMLEADYAMKRIMLTQEEASLPAFVAVNEAEADARTANPTAFVSHPARFWLVPAPLTPGDVHLSASYRTMLFDSRVLCRTEGIELSAGAGGGDPWKGTGDKTSWNARREALFNSVYDELERSPTLQPRGVFLRLHGLTDMVVAAKLLREFDVRFEVLDRFAELPMRHLPAGEAAPAWYPGVHLDLERGAYTYEIAGGAELRVRALRSSLDQFHDATTVRIEAAVDAFSRKDGFFAPLDLTFSLPRARADASELDRMDRLFDAGAEALANGDFAAARDRFETVTQEEPNFADAWVGLAAARSALDDRPGAVDALANAMAREPVELRALLPLADLAREASAALAAREGGDVPLRRLGDHFARVALGILNVRRVELARRLASFANDAIEPNPLANVVLALCTPPEDAATYRQQAIDLYRSRETLDLAARRQFVFVLAQEAAAQMAQTKAKMEPYAQSGRIEDVEAGRQLLEETQATQALMAEAMTLDPDNPLVASTAVVTEGIPLFVDLARGELPEHVDEVVADAREVVRRYPKFAPAHAALAYSLAARMQLEARRRGGAPGAEWLAPILGSLDEALRLDPSDAESFMMRGALHAALRHPAEALRDIERAAALGNAKAAELAEQWRAELKASAGTGG